MKKHFIFLLLACGIAAAQGGVGGLPAGVYIKAVANLPRTPKTGTVAVVTDGNSSSDCTVGGSSNIVFCVFGGSTWATFAGSGSGTVTSVTGTANQITVATGTTTPALSIPSDFRLPGTINLLTLTQPATAATLTILNNKTFTVNNTITLAGTDAQTYTFPATSATIARIDAANTFTGIQSMTSPNITTGISDANANGMFRFTATASAIDCWAFINAATANPATLEMQATACAAGDSNVHLKFTPLGTGANIFNSGTAANPAIVMAAGTTAGFFASSATLWGWSSAGVVKNALGANGFQTVSSNGYGWPSGSALGAQTSGIGQKANGIVTVDTSTVGNMAGFIKSGNTVFLTGDVTLSADTALHVLTGLTWTFPATNLNYPFHCYLTYSQATAAAANAIGVKATTTAPTQIYAQAIVYTSLSVSTSGALRALASTTATNVVAFTPSAAGAIGTTADMFAAEIWGTLEQASGATTFDIEALTGSASDALTFYRGGYCTLQP